MRFPRMGPRKASKEFLMKSGAQQLAINGGFARFTDMEPVERRAASSPAEYLAPLPRPQWLLETVWPFESSSLEIDVGQGPVLLFVHTGLWSFVWRDVILRLSRDFRCICFDAPGTGQSDRLPTRAISLNRAAETLTAIVLSLKLRNITLIVHDLGGP